MKPVIVGIGGTCRPNSSSECALKVVLRAVEAAGASALAFTGADLDLPFYDPGSEVRTPRASRLIDSVRQADGLVLVSPGYHGGLSGMIKNALDYLEDLASDPRAYLSDVPVGCVAVAHGNQAAVAVLSSLRTIVHSLRGFPTPYGAAVVAQPGMFVSGSCADEGVKAMLELIGQQLVSYSKSSARDANFGHGAEVPVST